jgi:hypothetical protein
MIAKSERTKPLRFAKQLISRPLAITERVHIQLAEIPNNKKGTFVNYAFVTGMVFFSMILPTFVTITPSRVTQEVAETSFTIEDRSIYYIELEDGSYEIYLEGVYIGNQVNPAMLIKEIRIYKSQEEAFQHEKIDNK